MNKLIIFTSFVVIILAGCKKEIPPAPCSESEDLGFVETESTLPYSAFEVLEFSNEIGATASVDINHPQVLGFANIQQVDTIQRFSDCLGNDEVIRYQWFSVENNVISSFGDEGYTILLKEHVILEDGNEKNGPRKRYLSFYAEDPFTGIVSDEPFMRFLASSNEQNESTFGFDYFEETVIDGVTFQDVYVNSEMLPNEVTFLIYNKNTGYIAYRQGPNLWLLNE